MTIELLAEDAISLISKVEDRPRCVSRPFYGGYVALSAYFRRPELFAGMVLVNSRAEADSPESMKVQLETARRVRETGGEGFRRRGHL